MDLLILFFLLAISISFICSILESVLLSLTLPYIGVIEKKKPRLGKILRTQKEEINTSIAAILILNTLANTLGAAAVGAQASRLYGDDAVVIASVILTFTILFLSEIIPKTIGALYWKSLAPICAEIIRIITWLSYPIILMTLMVTNKIRQSKSVTYSLSKEELLESMLQSEHEGVIDARESDFIENILHLREIKVREILTPRSVVFAIDESMSIEEVLQTQEPIFKFSRIPLYNKSMDDVSGVVLTKKIFKQSLVDRNVPIGTIKKDIFAVNENLPVSKALDLFIRKKEHMFLVLDDYGQTEGIITLEDCVETVLGVEIVDESDTVVDMRELAKEKMRLRCKSL